jgi:hypothetical protein
MTKLLLNANMIAEVNQILRRHNKPAITGVGCGDHRFAVAEAQHKKKDKQRTGIIIGACEHRYIADDGYLYHRNVNVSFVFKFATLEAGEKYGVHLALIMDIMKDQVLIF